MVVDDGGYGMLRYGHDPDADFGTELATPDFAAVARGFGIAARTVDGVGDAYRAALAEAVASGAPEPAARPGPPVPAPQHLAALAPPRSVITMAFRVTYATLSADNDELHAGVRPRHRGRPIVARRRTTASP